MPCTQGNCHQFGSFDSKPKKGSRRSPKTIRNHPEAIMNIHGFMEICLLVVGAFYCQTDRQMLSFPAVNGTKSSFIEPTLCCRIDFLCQSIEMRVRGSWMVWKSLPARTRSTLHMQKTPLHIYSRWCMSSCRMNDAMQRLFYFGAAR